MLEAQIAVEVAVLLATSALFMHLLRKFGLKLDDVLILFSIPILFVIGFSLRLTVEQSLIDLGYFFTDYAFLFTYLIFASAFLLGQFKYWKVKNNHS